MSVKVVCLSVCILHFCVVWCVSVVRIGIDARPTCVAFRFYCWCLCSAKGLDVIWSEKPVDFRLVWTIEDCISISVWIVHGPQRMIWVLSTHLSVIGRKVKWILLRSVSYVQVQVTVEFSHAQVQVLAEFSGVWWIVVGKEKSGVWWIAIGKEKWRLNLEFRAWRNSLESEVCGYVVLSLCTRFVSQRKCLKPKQY